MAHIHLVVGPVGAGKSTYCRSLRDEYRAVVLNLDEWMAALFRPDRPETGRMEWYLERTARCLDLIWDLTTRAIDVDTPVVLEIGLILRHDRERFYGRVDAAGYELTIHVLDAPRELRWERVQARNAHQGETFSMEVPEEIFEMVSDFWEPIDDVESEGRDVHWISTAPVGDRFTS